MAVAVEYTEDSIVSTFDLCLLCSKLNNTYWRRPLIGRDCDGRTVDTQMYAESAQIRRCKPAVFAYNQSERSARPIASPAFERLAATQETSICGAASH
jgi:hypothetical protein